MTDFNLDTAKVDELREYAANLNIELEDGATKTEIRSQIKNVLGEVDGAPADKADKAETIPLAKNEKYVWVYISNQGTETGPVSVSVQGIRVDIVRNQWARIKERYAEALDNARGMTVDPKTKQVNVQHSYPFQVRDTPPTKDFQTPKPLSFG